MYRAIKPNKYKFSDIQITESVISFTERKLQYTANFTQKHKKIAIHCKFHSETQENCNALQISLRNTRNLQCAANFPKNFRIFAAHFIFSNQDRMQNE